MALNFDKFISENENVSLEDLPIESLVQTDLDTNCTAFNKLFEDHLASLINQNGDKNKLLTDANTDLFDIDIDCIDIEDNFDKNLDIEEPLQECYINLTDFAYNSNDRDIYPDSDEIFSLHGSDTSDTHKESATTIRRQSTRIQNQIRKKIAEQIQRENIRLAKEAQRLNSSEYASKIDNNQEEAINAAANRNLMLPTDLDAEDDLNINEGEWKTTDDDPDKLWCICKQPYGFRFMICCDKCSEWYHGDCVGVTEEDGTKMEENGQDFICPVCEEVRMKKNLKIMEPVIISDDDDIMDDDNELLNEDGDDDCCITKTTQPPSKSNIFQIFKSTKSESSAITQKKSIANILSARTSVCLFPSCKTLVNPKRSLYCSKKCIVKYTQMVKKNNLNEKVAQYGLVKGTKLAKISRFVLAQIETEKIRMETNLKEFLIKNPTYRVFQSAKSTKTKQDQIESKKVNDSLRDDAVKRVKIVKHFSLIFKKTDQNEFRSIWQQCVDLEDSLYSMCEKSINEKYISKVKELSEIFKQKFENRMSSDAINDKSFIGDLLTKTKNQIHVNCKTNLKTGTKNGINKKSVKVGKTGISTLLSDTTHLHSQHLYDINCKICNGTSKTNAEKKKAQAEEKKEEQGKALEAKEQRNKSRKARNDLDNIVPPTDSCSTESIVTSWFIKTAEMDKNVSPHQTQSDEFKVTSTVETPDMAVDMEISSTPSVSEPVEIVSKTVEPKVDSSSSKVEKSPSKTTNSKPHKHKLVSVWEGEIMYKEIGNTMCKTYLVSRYQLGKSKKDSTITSGEKLREEINLSANLDNQIKIDGRMKMSVAQDYFVKLRKHSNKEFLVFRLHPINLEEGRVTYLKIFEFLHGKDRCGVINQKRRGLKDCYIYPLNAHSKIPSFLLPLNGPGFEKKRPHLLLMLVVRTPLEDNIYKSFSPKYDTNYDFNINHGINLDKYYQPPLNPEVCPSPIVGLVPEEPIPDTESVKSDINNNSHVVDEKDVPFQSKSLEEEENVSSKENEVTESICPPLSDQITQQSLLNEIHSSQTPIKPTSNITSNLDQNFSPLKLNDTKIPSRPQSDVIPVSTTAVTVTVATTISADSTRISPQNTEENNLKFSRDFDFRVISNSDSFLQSPCFETSVTSSSNAVSRSPVSKRFYTLYDAHFGDPEFELKRSRYFFNPRFPTDSSNSNRSLPL